MTQPYRDQSPPLEPIYPLFKKEAPCKKCGYKLTSDQYDATDDVIKRRCVNCQFIWKETPLG